MYVLTGYLLSNFQQPEVKGGASSDPPNIAGPSLCSQVAVSIYFVSTNFTMWVLQTNTIQSMDTITMNNALVFCNHPGEE